jgi:hypothetical protein
VKPLRKRRHTQRSEGDDDIVGSGPTILIGFDTEWVNETADPLDHDDSAEDGDAADEGDADARLRPDQIPRNRILSYQYACWCKGREWTGIWYTRAGARIRFPDKSEAEILAKFPERVTIAALATIGIRHGIHDKHLARWPKRVILAAHWTRADLPAFGDFSKIKRQFDCVQKTYVTLEKPYRAKVTIAKHLRAFDVFLLDTRLLAPGSSKSLAALGDLYQFNKIDLGYRSIVDSNKVANDVPYIERMDWLIEDDPTLYERYAIRDAEICVRHVNEILKFVKGELDLRGVSLPPITLGSLAVRYLVSQWQRLGIDPEAILGRQVQQQRHFRRTTNRYLTQPHYEPLPAVTLYEPLAKAAFCGGRNECFWYGPTIDTEAEGQPAFQEYDLISAYATALASLGMPDYERTTPCTDPARFGPKTLGFARIRFSFPEHTRFPSLPVPAADDHGLIYPLEGETYVPAPEIAVARRIGARIVILDGVVIPWRDDGLSPFMEVIAYLARRRDKHDKGTLPNDMFKQLANSLYGKLGQGLRDRRCYNTRHDRYEKIGPSEITSPFLAAHVTGLVRALISELIAGIPTKRQLISVTTDGFITNALIDEVDMTGPVASHFIAVRRSLNDKATLLESKYGARRLLPWRTRGIATLKRSPGLVVKLARGGMREPGRMSHDEANDWFAPIMLLRQPGDRWSSDDPLPFPEAHRSNADHVLCSYERTMNFEYDMKRRPVDPSPWYVQVPGDPDLIVQHIRFGTDPWRTVAQFNEYRERFERWRQTGRQLKTITDWRNWRAFDHGAGASKAGIHRSKGGPVDQSRRLFLRAYVRRCWGLPGGAYKRAAERMTVAGYAATEQDFKNALRSKAGVPESLIPADAPGVREFVKAMIVIWPEFEHGRLVAGELETGAISPSTRRFEGL